MISTTGPGLHSRTLASVDLRLTRPPDNLRRPDNIDRPRSQDGRGPEVDERPVRKKKGKVQASKKDNEALFEDMSPEAQRRLNAMLRNFCQEDNGSMRTDIDLEQYALDAGEVITNATIQELCVVQPNMLKLNLKSCALITDVALWTIARHCPGIKHLILSGCDKITNIGLRSLSMRCADLVTLDFTNCHLLDDLGLSTIACGCWKLETLLLVNCTGVTDTGVGKVVKACPRLRKLDLHGCCRVGEFGDHALKEIGAFCPALQYLDLIGCRHVHNAGLTALAQGCQELEILRLSGCDGVTGQGILALCKHSKHLRILQLSGCETLKDSDVNVLRHAAFGSSITSVDLSDCVGISNTGVAAICASLGESLRELNIAGCHVTDAVCGAICSKCTKLNSLDMSRCRALTDNTVHAIARGVTGLTSLKLDGNQKITSRAVVSYGSGEQKLEFANVSRKWFGFEPKQGASNLIVESEERRFHSAMAIKIQCMVRSRIAWNVYKEKRRMWIVDKAIPKYQALYRGYKVKMRYAAHKQHMLKIAMAIRIQKCFRRYQDVMARYLVQRTIRINKMKLASAINIQRVYWGMKGRQRSMARRNEVANERLEAARIQALKERMAIVIQCAWLIHRARVRMMDLKEARRLKRIRDALEDRMARVMQRVVRGHFGRRHAERVRWYLERQALVWRMAKEIQRVYRGHVGRLIAAEERRLRDIRIRNEKAVILQCFWRILRANMLVSILRALRILRQKQFHNAREIQRVFRGMVARVRLEKFRSDMEQRLKLVLSSIKIQKLFRGHKAREIAEVERALKASEGKAKPLYALLRELEEEGIKETKNYSRIEGWMQHTEHEVKEIVRELDHATRTTAKFTDSTRINGIPQRFLTKYLIVRLNDHLENEKEVLKKYHSQLVESKANLRVVDRKIRAVKRELVPLTTGLIVKTKKDRFNRLRSHVRKLRAAATKIQALWRRAIVRTVYTDPNRDYWVECYDEEQGPDPYYYNTWTLETVWKPPAAYVLFVSRYKQNAATNPTGDDWIEIEENGIMYHYNLVTKEYVQKA
mmetsp:Transcript_15428/g.23272  ORF Transcript_15428/g.23272 Transcript_15428/m.23272 type:complete len:1050 (+) Transcript_15428:143-3292(+)